MRITQLIRAGAASIMQWMLPLTCAGCGRHVESNEWPVCHTCIQRLSYTEHAHYRQNEVERLFADDDKFVRGGALCYYYRESVIHEMLIRLKFRNNPEIGRQLGRLLAERFLQEHYFDGIDLIVPLPLHTIRLRERGYNQSEYIASGISQMTGIPIDTTHFVRVRNNEKQSMQTWQKRIAAEQMFDLQSASDWRGKHILLVDDIVTSGTTLRHAMSLLHSVRECHYSVLTIGFAHKPRPTEIYAADRPEYVA